MKICKALFAALALAASASAQTITAVSPNTTPQGTTGMTVTFTISNTMLPPADVMPSSVSIGTFSGSSVARPFSDTVTAVFDIDFSEDPGAKDAIITFVAPFGTETYASDGGFTITEGADTPPTITTDPSSITATTNTPATFSVVASGSSPMSYQWQNELADILNATNSSYAIVSVAESDVGDYRCIASNPFGSATSAVASLTIDTNVFAEGYVLTETGQAGCYDTNGLAITPSASRRSVCRAGRPV